MFPDTLTQVPWYTLVALGTLALLLLGAWLAVAKLLWRTVGTVASLPWWGLTGLCSLVFGRPLTSHGTAAWCTPRQRTKAGICGDGNGLALAQTVHGEPIQEVHGRHCVIFGPPRSGKSRRVLMPLLRTTRASVVVSDLRDELHRETHEAREALGPVYRFSPGEEQSDGLNPLDLVRWSTAHAWADVHRQVHRLVAPEPGALFDGPAVTLLVAIALYCHAQDEGSYPGMLAWMQDPARALKEKMQALLTDANPHVAAGGRTLADYSERMRMGIWGRALESLTVFMDPVVGGHTDHSAVDLRDLQHGLKPVSLYLNVDFADVKRLGPLLGLIVDSLVAVCGGPQPTAPRHQVMLVLDELANLGHLEELETSVSHLQGSGVQVVAAFQNLPQMHQTFGQDTPLLASFGAQLHYRPADLTTATFVSNLCGMGTVMAPNVNAGTAVTWGLEQASTTLSVGWGSSATGRPLLLPDEVLRLGDDAALVFLEGLPPIVGRKLGLPPISRLVQAGQWANAHRETAAGLAVAALLVLALHPLWSPLMRPPPPQVAQGGLMLPVSTSPTTPPPSPTEAAAAATSPSAEVPSDPTHTEALPSLLRKVQAGQHATQPLAQGDRPWRLMSQRGPAWGLPGPTPQGRYTDEETCQRALESVWGSQAKQWENEARLGVKGIKVSREHGKLHWERLAAGQQVINEAWCEKD